MFLVTGATGNVGSEVVEQLLAAGEQVRVFTRDAGKAARWAGRVEAVTGSFEETDRFAAACTGAKGVFLMNAAVEAAVFERLVEAAKKAGVETAVFLSSVTAGTPELAIGRMHLEKEDAIRAAGLTGRFVRATGFMTNTLAWKRTINAEGAVYHPLGDGRAAVVAQEDMAAVAVKALTAPETMEEVLEVTGGAAMTVAEQVAVLERVLGRTIRCVEISVAQAVAGMVQAGVPEPVARAVGESFAVVREGGGAGVSDTVRRVVGREPVGFEPWARRHFVNGNG